MSGTPFTVFDSNDFSVQGSAPEISGFFSNRPNVVADRIPTTVRRLPASGSTRAHSSKSLRTPTLRSSSSARRAAISRKGPGYANWDFSAFKNFRITESKELQFRAEFFNFLNHPNFRLPDSDINSPTFDQILTAQTPRLIQFALKFTF